MYTDLQVLILQLDFLRYMILAAEGGVYADTGTHAVKPLRSWVPKHLRKKTAAVVGIEYDRLNDTERTGPAMWSKVVFKSLSMAIGRDVSIEDLSGLKEPTLFGNILVLPIDGFATNVGHSGSGRHGEQALIIRGFKGSWRGLESD
ncbi:glycosyltransferase sugar-binding region DXD domain-containing protein-containing protein [Cryomyces antarcticus]